MLLIFTFVSFYTVKRHHLLNNNRLLLTFRANTGMDTHKAQPLGGWGNSPGRVTRTYVGTCPLYITLELTYASKDSKDVKRSLIIVCIINDM